MPTRYNTSYLRLKDDDEFEELLRDICDLEWSDPSTARNGRTGQGQNGVDVYGQPAWLKGAYYGVQCKLRPSQRRLTKDEIENEVKASYGFPHPLEKLIIATDAPRDNNIQVLIDKISEREIRGGGHEVEIWFWPDIERRIAAHLPILVKYYRDHLTSLTNTGVLERLIDRPLQALSIKLNPLANNYPLELLLRLRGVRTKHCSSDFAIAADYRDLLPDGLLCQLGGGADFEDLTLLQLKAMLLGIARSVDPNCPIFVISPTVAGKQLETQLNQHEKLDRFEWLADDLPPAEIANHIFEKMFTYGYVRRGTIPTVNISAGTTSQRSIPILLDLDWQPHLSTQQHPSPNEWSELFLPAIRTVTTQLTKLSESTRIQIDSDLPVPASVALGFYLNLRVALLGVWARPMGKRDIRRLWLSDAEPAQIKVFETWFKEKGDDARSAIVEITCGTSIHPSVEAFTRQQGLKADVWVQSTISVDQNRGGIDEAVAIAVADYTGTLVRELTAQGVTDSHLFLRVPTALGVLMGQKLQACGRIHLYWFDNKSYSYKPAFVLA